MARCKTSKVDRMSIYVHCRIIYIYKIFCDILPTYGAEETKICRIKLHAIESDSLS